MCKDCFYTKTQEPYEFLLQRRAWKAKREIILARDNHRCTMCGKEESPDTILHVHHKHYIYGLDPWEYKDSELTTLCEKCHSKIHLEGDVPVYYLEEGSLKKAVLEPCYRCGGTGYLPQYRHVQDGICFRCYGARYEQYIGVYEDYAKEHNIDLSNINRGFMPVDNETKRKIKEVLVMQSRYDSEKLYLKIILPENKYANALLDYAVEAKSGDRINVSSLQYKKYLPKGASKETLVFTGKVK